MRIFRQLINLLPVRLGGRRDTDFQSLGGRIYSNRRDPNSGFVFLGDLIENTRDEWFGLTRRLPGPSRILRDENNRVHASVSNIDRSQQ